MADELNGAPVEPVTQPDPVEPAEQPLGFRERFEAAGYNLEGYDDDKLFQALTHGLQRASRADELEAIAAQARPYLDRASEIDEFLRSKQAEQQAKPAEPEKPNRWKAPVEYDPEWEKFTRHDPELGRWVLRDEFRQYGMSPAVAENMNKYKAWETQNARHITQNFPDAVREAVADALAEQEAKFDKRLGAYTQEMRNMALAQNFLKANLKEFFHTDAAGNVMLDHTGREAMTPKGQMFDHFVNEAHSIGVTDPQAVIKYATALTNQAMSEHAAREAEAKKAADKAAKAKTAGEELPAGPLTPSQKNAAQKESFLARTNRIREERKANVAEPTAETNRIAAKEGRRSRISFAEMMRENFNKAGIND